MTEQSYKEQFDNIIYTLDLMKRSPFKDTCLTFIKNTDIDLNLRWAVFKEMPEDFLKRESYQVTFKIEKKLPQKEIFWYDDFYIERYQTVKMIDLIDDLEKRLIEPDLYNAAQIWPKELIDAFKEEILQKELESFLMDW